MLSPILVPTDFSPASTKALAYALELATAMEADVRLLHVLNRSDLGPAAAETQTEAQEGMDEATQALAALRQLAATASVSLPCVVREGRVPAEEILGEAEDMDIGLIVLGTCGQRPARPGLGAVASEIIQLAPCDVLLVPHSEAAAQVSIRRILVPIDFSGASRPLLALGQRLAEALGAQLDLVHVLEPLPHPVRWLDETLVDLVPEIQERAATALRALASGVSSSVLGGLYVERGKAAPSIPRIAKALESDLILLGPHAERPVFDKLLGSVAEGVARRASCPVLVARASASPDGSPPDVNTHSYEAAA
ncbi:MAG: universal stress protein [Bacteroidota bacterium]